MSNNIYNIIEAKMFGADIDDILGHFGLDNDEFMKAVGIRFANAMAIDSDTLRDLNSMLEDEYIIAAEKLRHKLHYLTYVEAIKVIVERIESNSNE